MVKCAECGFLALRNKESRELEEAEESFREGVALPLVDGGSYYRHEERPLCFARRYDLRKEIREKEERKWGEEQRRLDLEWRERKDKKAETRHRWDLIVLGIIVTLIISFASIAASLIVRGIWFPTN